MARKTLKQRIALDGGKEIEAELKALGAAGEEAFARLKDAAKTAAAPAGKLSEAVVKLKGNVVKLRSAGERLGKTFRTMGQRFSDVVSTVRTVTRRMVGLAAAALGAAAAIIAVARSGAAAVDAAAKTAEGLGLTIEEYSRLRFAAAQAGVGAEQFGSALNKLNGNVVTAAAAAADLGNELGRQPGQWADAQRSSVTAAASLAKTAKTGNAMASAFKQLGVEVRETGLAFNRSQTHRSIQQFQDGLEGIGLSGQQIRPVRSVLMEVAEAFKGLPDGIEKSALAARLFGQEAGRRLLPFLNKGAAGIRALENEADQLGVTLTDFDAKVARNFVSAQGRLGASIKALKDQIGLLFAPALTKAADRQTEAIKEHRKALLSGVDAAIPRAVALVEDLVAALTGRDADVRAQWIITARDAIVDFARAVKAAFDSIIVPAFQGLLAIFDEVAVAINGAFGTNFTGQSLLVTAAVAQMLGVFSSLGTVVLGTTALLVGVLPEALALLQDVVAAIQGRDQDVNAKWVLVVRDAILDFAKDVKTAFADILFPAFQKLLAIADKVAGGINAIFGTEFSGTSLLIAAAIGKWLGLFSTLAALLIIVNTSIGLAVVAMKIIAVAATLFVGTFAAIPLLIAATLVGITALVVLFWDEIKAGGAATSDFLKDIFVSVVTFIARKIKGLISFIKSAARIAKRLFSSSKKSSAGVGGSGGGSGLSGGGGPLRGPGSKTSDSIPARLSRGEFVIRAAAVDRYGPSLFAALNSLKLPRNPLPGFALGGLVDGITASLSSLAPAPVPAFAMGGAVAASGGQAGRPVILNLDGQQFNLSAEDSVAEALTRTALRQQRSSAGRKPAWFGG